MADLHHHQQQPHYTTSTTRRQRQTGSPPPIVNQNKGIYMFTTFLWVMFFAVVILLNAVVQGYPGMVKKPDTDARPRLYRVKEMVNIMKDIRAGDYRLVRPSPSEESIVEQHRWCPYKLQSFVMTLCTAPSANKKVPISRGKMSVSLHKRGVAAEAITLCLLNQPEFRDLASNVTFLTDTLKPVQQKQLVGYSLAQGLTVLLQESLDHYLEYADGSASLAMAQAAETVWIASFHYPHHIEGFIQHNTIQVLGDVIVKTRPSGGFLETVEYPYPPAHAVMWAAAALQNLAANYCDNELGYCIWQWQEQNTDDNTQILGLDDTALERSDLSSQARTQIAAIPNLLETLTEWICQVGPVHSKVNETYGWPGEAILWKDLTFNAQSPHLKSPSIVPWAAAGVIKNLLLGKDNAELQQRLQTQQPNLLQCLCRMKRYSPDWLEHGKASDAVRFWGPPSDRVCGPIFPNCRDDTEWVHAESGETCIEYTRERYCIEYGEDVDANGKTANDACCLCGGGYPVEDRDEETPDAQDKASDEQEEENAGAIGEEAETAERTDHTGGVQEEL